MGAALPVGQAMTSAAARSFSRPPTLSSSVNFPIGVVFLQPVVVPLDAARVSVGPAPATGRIPPMAPATARDPADLLREEAMNGSRGLADVLRGLIETVPVLAWLVVVLAAVAGIFLAGYAMVRFYHTNAAGDGTAAIGSWRPSLAAP